MVNQWIGNHNQKEPNKAIEAEASFDNNKAGQLNLTHKQVNSLQTILSHQKFLKDPEMSLQVQQLLIKVTYSCFHQGQSAQGLDH